MAFQPGDRVRYTTAYVGLPEFRGRSGSVVPSLGRSADDYTTRVKFDGEICADDFLSDNLTLISSAEQHQAEPRTLPVTTDSASIGIAAVKSGRISVSVLGHEPFELDAENAIALADYIRRSTKHSLRKQADSL